ncbi:MAG TPA: succinylglutamate desuccinylase/aspartoacylase family protein [Alphaproteobacteria bacterium]|nr:succinylglutamate desuccinylase/aspartoacylase family protein [Alphaproteobacteria bacterium]
MVAFSEKNPFLRSIEYQTSRPGPALLITGAVHGDEVCGPRVITEIEAQFANGNISLRRGSVTFIPIVNAKAFLRGTRDGDRNLNRDLRLRTDCVDYEDHVANALFAQMSRHDVLLDVHSFPDPGRPFVFVGPTDNDGDLQPFGRSREERKFAAALGVEMILSGWLDAFAKAVDTIRMLAAKQGLPVPGVSTMRGVGTTELMRRLGGYAVTLECGQHSDPRNDAVAMRAIRGALQCLEMLDPPEALPRTPVIAFRLTEALVRRSARDQLKRQWKHFDPVKKGEVVAVLDGIGEVTAPHDGVIVLPFVDAEPLTEWLYFAQPEAV